MTDKQIRARLSVTPAVEQTDMTAPRRFIAKLVHLPSRMFNAVIRRCSTIVKNQRRRAVRTILRLVKYLMQPNKKILFLLWLASRIAPASDGEEFVPIRTYDRYPRR